MPRRALEGSRQLFFASLGILVVFAILVYANPVLRARAQYLYEDAKYLSSPSAQNAFDLGELHFSASDPNQYDIDRAEHFFKIAASSDPKLPYVHHELARIAFLKGSYATALSQIDLEITLYGDSEPNAYYVRALIEGYMGNYTSSEVDYARYLASDPINWAALNDYAWVLIKDKKFSTAAAVTGTALQYFPVNPWLLNSHAIALYEMGNMSEALKSAGLAAAAAASTPDSEWLEAYPGNDPAIAGQGVASLRAATLNTMHSIEEALASSTVQ